MRKQRPPRPLFPFARRRRQGPLTLEELENRLAPSVNVFSYHGDNSSDGENLNETTLTPANVNTSNFGKLFAAGVDGQVYGEPLYVAGVNINTGPNQGIHNVAYVTTEHDSVYAFNADDGTPLWQDSLLVGSYLPPGAVVTPTPAADTLSTEIIPEVGITSTPVIDPGTNTLYVTPETKEVYGGNNHYVRRLHALDLGSGAEKFGGPTVIADTTYDGTNYTYVSGPFVNGSGDGSVGGIVHFNALRQLQRTGLTLANGNVYMGFAGHDDHGPYHGWVLSYNASTLQLDGVFCTTPNGGGGGVWQGGGRVAVDTQGFFYVMTGNGSFNNSTPPGTFPGDADYGDSFIKIGPDPTTNPNNQNANGWGLKVVDFFTPFNQQGLNNGDVDLGSGGADVLPDSVGSSSHPHLLVGAGKEGRIYLIDRDSMGKFDPNTDHVVQEQPGALGVNFDTPAYFNNTIYFVAQQDQGKTFSIANAMFSASPTSVSPDVFGLHGSTPTISANGTSNGIVWDTDLATSQLRAYNAGSYAQELYTSAQAGNNRDTLGTAVKFSVPTVVNGKVYVGTSNALVVYGLFGPPAGPPNAPTNLNLLSGSSFQLSLTWQDHANNESGFKIDRSSDGVNFTQVAVTGVNATSYTDTGLAAGATYYYRVRATNAVGDSAYSNVAGGTTPPGNWTDADVGTPAASGSSTYAGGVFTVLGSGADIGGSGGTDAFNFLYQTLTGDGTILARVVSVQDTDPAAKAGVMVRNSLDPSSLFADVTVTPGSGSALGARTLYDGVSVTASGPAVTAPYWVELVRMGNTLTGYVSPDGINFTQVGSYYLALGNTVDIGLAVTSHDDGLLGTATFDNVTIRSTAAPGPPPAPTGLAAKGTDLNDVQLTWTDNASNETGFKVERSTDGVNFSQVALTGASVSSFTDTGLPAGTLYYYRVKATNPQGDSTYTRVASTATVAGGGTVYLSDLSWTSASNGQGPVERDMSNGGFAAGDGRTMTMNGVTYTKGLGTHAVADIVYNLNYNYTNFLSDVGLDSQASSQGSVDFQVFADGTKIFDSGVMTKTSPTKTFNLNVTGVGTLELKVLANGSNTNGDFTDWGGARLLTVPSAPGAPSGLTATPDSSGTAVALSWANASVSQTGVAIEVSTDGVNFTQVATANPRAISFLVANLQPTTPYTFRIRALNGIGPSPYSGLATATTLAGASVAELDYSAGFAGTAGQFSFNGGPWAAQVGSGLRLTDGGANEAGSIFTTRRLNLTAFNSVFTFQVLNGTNPCGEGFTITFQNVNPSALGGKGKSLGFAGIGNSVAVKFDLVSDAGEGPDSTGLYVNGAQPTSAGSIDLSNTGIDLHSGDVFQVALNYDGTTLTVTITDLNTQASATQAYAINIPATLGSTGGFVGFTGGTSSLTALQNILTWTFTPSPLPAPPTNLVAEADGGTQVALTWTDNAGNATGYDIERSADGIHYSVIASVSGPATSYLDTGLNLGTTYYYLVQAFNASGSSPDSNVVQVTTPALPAAPTGAQATLVTTTEIDLAWTDNATNATGYKIYRETGSGSPFILIATLSGTSTSYRDLGRVAGTTYDYRVQAFNSAGFSGYAEILATTVSLAPAAPAATPGDGQAVLTWAASTGATSYNIYRSTTPGGEGPTPYRTGVTGTAFTDTGLTDGLTYYYLITAVDGGGESSPSSEVSANPFLPHLSLVTVPGTTAGIAFSATVILLDPFNNVYGGYRGTVRFTSTDAGTGVGLPGDYAFTAGDAGQHVFTVTLVSAGGQSLTVTDAANQAITGGVTVQVNPASASSIVLTGFASTNLAGAASSFTVTAYDAFGNVATGYAGTVHFGSTDPGAGASLPADYAFTPGDAGSHTFWAALVTAGGRTLTAADAANPTITAGASTQVIPAAAGSLTVTDLAAKTFAGIAASFTVTAYDPFGNQATGYAGTVHFSSTDLDSGVSLPVDYTFTPGDVGRHVFSAILVTSGDQTLTASDTLTNTITGSATTLVSTPSGSLAFTATPLATVAGVAFSLTLTAYDADGNVATGYTGTVHFSGTDIGNGVGLPADYTFTPDDAGVQTFSVILVTAGLQTVTATDTGLNLLGGSLTILVNPAAASSLTLTGLNANSTAGTANAFTLTAYDSYGNLATGYAGTVHFSSTDIGIGVGLPADYTFTSDDAGAHTFSAVLVTAGGQMLAATDTAGQTITSSATTQVTAAAASRFTLAGLAGTTTAGTAVPVTLTAYDPYGNLARGYTGTVHFSSTDAGAGVRLPADYTFTNGAGGQHVLAVTLVSAGIQTLSATDTSNQSLTASATTQVTAAAASGITLTGLAGTTSAGMATPFTVTAYDAFGNVATGYAGTVRFSSTDHGTGVGLPADYTFAPGDAGVHTFAAILVTVGSRALNVTDTTNQTMTAGASTQVVAAAASTLTLTGLAASTTAGTAASFTVTAYDSYGNQATGYAGTVHFTSTDTGADVSLPTDYTFTSGDAGRHAFSAIFVTAGSQTLTTTDLSSGVLTANAGTTVIPGAFSQFALLGLPLSSVAGTADNFALRAQDAFGNTITGYAGSVHFTSSDGQAFLPADYTFGSADQGQHNFTVTFKTSGPQSLVARDVSANVSSSENISVTAAAANRFTVTGFPSPDTAGVAQSFTVTALDPFGNVANGYAGTVKFSSTDAKATLPVAYTFNPVVDRGSHTFTATLVTAGTRSLTTTDSSNKGLKGSQSGIVVNPAAANHYQLTAPASVGEDVPFTITVKVLDPYGNVVTNWTGTVKFTSTDSRAILPPAYTFQASDKGVHPFTNAFRMESPGSQQIKGTDATNKNMHGQASVKVQSSGPNAILGPDVLPVLETFTAPPPPSPRAVLRSEMNGGPSNRSFAPARPYSVLPDRIFTALGGQSDLILWDPPSGLDVEVVRLLVEATRT